jgi:TolB-like protein/class 3 adenylate cyclase/Flp pilus assembly protein TadD
MSETRKLVAILVADVVGYSRLAGADEDRTLARLRGLRSDLIDPAIAAHHGRIVKRTGDGSIIEFRSVVDAVRCAIEMQTGLIERNAGLPPERRIEFRVGIHVGDVVEESDGDLMGDGVNIAARLEGIAKPGHICLSEQAYWQVKSRLDLKVSDLGPTLLKNIAEPVRVYSLEVGQPNQAKLAAAATPERLGAPRLSIVVLPFANIGGDPEQDYFVDGVTESLTTDLSRIAGAFVIARNTAFTFKGRPIDVRATGRDLNVRYVLEGSVQRAASRMRVNVQLVDAEIGAHLWAERFDKPVADLFDMQDEIVARLANSLGYELVKAEAERGARSSNPNVIDLTMRGWTLLWRGQPQPMKLRRETYKEARAVFDRALKIDPNDADALAGSANTYFADYLFGWSDAKTDYEDMVLGQTGRAIALAPNNVRAFYVKAVYLSLSRRPREALATADTGLAVNPNFVSLFSPRIVAENSLGRFDEAKVDVQRAMRLSPRDPFIGSFHVGMGDAELGLGNVEAAIDAYRKALDSGYQTFFAYSNLSAAYVHAGNMDAAKAALTEARYLNPAITIKWMQEHTANLPAVFDGLRRAGLPEE